MDHYFFEGGYEQYWKENRKQMVLPKKLKYLAARKKKKIKKMLDK